MIPEGGALTTMTATQLDHVLQKRSLVRNMVSGAALRVFEPRCIEYINTFCDQLCATSEDGSSKVVNISVQGRSLPNVRLKLFNTHLDQRAN